MVKKKRKKEKRKKEKRKKRVSKPVKIRPAADGLVKRTKVRVIGIGGGAGSIISEIVYRVKKADFVVANTDTRALKAIKKAKRFQFGQDLTHGLGTGMNMELGEMAAQNEKEKIKKLFEEQDICIIVASLGGGTGSGATPIFAKISKSSGCLTYGIFTLPFEFEGEKKMEIAREALLKIKPNLNAFSVVPNERIFQIIDKNTPLKDALSAINERLAKNLEGLIEMIYLPGLINIDFADLKTILAGRGRLTYLNTIEIEEPNKEEASKRVIFSPLYPYTTKGARGILYNIVGGKTLQLSEVSQISKIISDSVNKNAKIIFGISQNQKYQAKIKITLLATGCGMKDVLLRPIEKPKPLTISKEMVRGKARKPKAKQRPKPRPKPEPEPKPKPKAKPKRKLKPLKKKVIPQTSKKPEPPVPLASAPNEGKVRRTALQLRKVIEEEEKELLEQEKVWETPAIFRRKNNT